MEEPQSSEQHEVEKLHEKFQALVSDASERINEIKAAQLSLATEQTAVDGIKASFTKAEQEVKTLVATIETLHGSLFDPSKNTPPVGQQLTDAAEQVKTALERIKTSESQIDELKLKFFGPYEGLAKGFQGEIESKVEELRKLHATIFQATGTQKPVSDQVNTFVEEFNKKKTILETAEEEILEFQDDLLGTIVEGQRKGGIKAEVDEYMEALDDLLDKHTKQQQELLRKVEDLLAGASTAALGKAFSAHKASYDQDNEFWRYVFLGSAGLIMLVPLVGLLMADLTSQNWLQHLLVRLPIVGGAVTLLWYASKQRSQNKRLQEEYAHKEDVAMMYVGLKKEVDVLGSNELGKKLREDVLKTLVTTVARNPSKTLDHSSHNDKGPVHEAFKKGMEAAKDIAKEVVPKVMGGK